MALLGSSERETGPVRSVFFHPEGECMFSGTQDSLKVGLDISCINNFYKNKDVMSSVFIIYY